MVDYAAAIEVWSNGEAKREEITNYDEVQDYLAETIDSRDLGRQHVAHNTYVHCVHNM